jgi:hypothetical protein
LDHCVAFAFEFECTETSTTPSRQDSHVRRSISQPWVDATRYGNVLRANGRGHGLHPNGASMDQMRIARASVSQDAHINGEM